MGISAPYPPSPYPPKGPYGFIEGEASNHKKELLVV